MKRIETKRVLVVFVQVSGYLSSESIKDAFLSEVKVVDRVLK